MQATLWGFGVPILLTTALAVCSLHPVATIAIQGVLHLLCGAFFSVCNVAIDVNLHAILQAPLCDVSCETLMDLMTARVYAPRGLNSNCELGHDRVGTSCAEMHALPGCGDLFHVFWSIVLMWTVVALSSRFHHPVYCRPLSSVVAFVLCIGGPADRVVVAFAAYCLPAFPARVNESDDVSSASERGSDEAAVDWDFDMQMATALSLSAEAGDNADGDLQEALESSLMADSRDKIESLPGALQDLPDYVLVHGIQPDGWCFYDSVRKQLFPNGQDGTECEQITTATVAGLCVSCLAQRREQMECFVADSQEFRAKRIVALSREPAYQGYVNTLDNFQVYVLDKLEAVLRPTRILDTHHYADTPEIEALLQTLGLSMLRVRPVSDWRQNDIGTFQKMHAETIKDEVHLRALLASADVDLKMLHYQYPGFEHYDVLSSYDRGVGMEDPKKNTLVHAISESPLLRCLRDDNLREYRRNALLLVGVVADPGLSDGEASEAESSSTSAGESVASSAEGNCASDSCDSVVETGRADTDQPLLPPGVPMPLHPRVRGKRFCAGYNTRTHCADGVLSDIPSGVPTVLYPRGQDIVFTLRR